MLTLTIFVLLLITILLPRNYIKIKRTLLITTLILFYMTGIGVFSSYLLSNLESYPRLDHPNWKQHNVIILLGDGAVKLPKENTVKPTILAYSRIYETARLYFLCRKTNAECKIIISGGDALATGKSEAEVYKDALNSIDVKNSDIILEPNSMNTYKNAEFTQAILKTKKFDNILLVTSGFHMQRALLYFSHFGIKATPAVSDCITMKISIIPLGYNFAITDFVMHEYIGIIRFYIYNYFGLNTKVTTYAAANL